MSSKTNNQAYYWQAFSTLVISLLFIYIVRDSFKSTPNITPDMNLTQQLSLYFLSMLNPVFWLNIIAPICYITALVHASNIFGSIAKGENFSQSIIIGLNKMGSNLIWGACAAIFIAPSLSEWPHYVFSFKIHASTENYVIMIVGAALFFISKQGEIMRSEMDAII